MRLVLKNITHFELDIQSIVQFILGTNGSGKSSVIDQLTPLPPPSNLFYKGGYVEKVIEKDNVMYYLTSTFNGKDEHSFCVGSKDNNLNPGGTRTVQRELVKQHFDGLTPDLHELQVGKLMFTRMSTNERRYWLTRISNTDYTYVIGVYNKLKEKHRDIAGTLRTLKKRLVQEMEKIVVDAQYQKNIEESVDLLHNHLTTLLEVRKPLEDHPDDLKADLKKLHDELLTTSNRLIKTVLSTPNIRSLGDNDSINNTIQELDGQMRANYLLCDTYMQDISKLDETISLVEKTNQKSSGVILNEIVLDQQKLQEIMQQKTLVFKNKSKGVEMLSALNSIKDFLEHIATTLPENKDMRYSRSAYQQYVTRLEKARIDKHNTEELLGNLSVKKKHMELHMDTPDMVCPRCDHRWKPGFTQEGYNNLLVNMEKANEKLEYHKREIKTCEDAIREMQEYFQLFKSVNTTFDMWPTLSDLRDLVTDKSVLMESPNSITFVVRNFAHNIELLIEDDRLCENIAAKQQTLKIAEQLGSQDLDKLLAQRKEYETKLYNVNTQIAQQRHDVQKYKDVKNGRETISKLSGVIDQLQAKIQDTHSKTKEAIRIQHFNEYVKHVQSVLTKKELAIVEIRGQRAVVADIENQISLLTGDEESLKLLLKELSPVDGLIAEGMCGFIKVFMAQLNTFINKSWTYTLEVVPKFDTLCGDKVDLDYLFGVAINGKVVDSIKDVNECSTGQREIINLAFKVMGMKHLGLGNYPLMLDEFAATMDNAHRITTTQMLKTLIEQHSFSQLFMANHYDSIYGAFSNAQFNVLCEENIVMPTGCAYNKHLVMR